ncbi:hypothetical protein FMJ68_00030 [Klebsiella grimontii]|uniref:hypothetical protein n=1 Tax=Klebsiella grimontii TaxID=2058152 RepID=UPI001CCDC1FF|nr:hypothetical protein [Klebsiella grimontii]MBZ6567090.1 hypothetical protein [Klebsiella grimontii]MBZ7376070.1 hypothetical protein [Klebsiella grimontii]
MNRMVLVLLISFFLAGCGTNVYKKSRDFASAETLQEKRDALIKWMPSYNGQLQNFPKIRNELISLNGENETFINGLVLTCFNSKDENCTYDYYVKEVSRLNDLKCDKDVACVRDREVMNASDELNRVYYLVMARNQYNQGEFDLYIRNLCRAAGIGQRRGVSLGQMLNDVNQEPGLSPEVRSQFSDVARSCWVLSKNGIDDATTTIRNAY